MLTEKAKNLAVDIITQFEGLEKEAYLDPVGKWTIGYGHTGAAAHAGSVISELTAEKLLASDLEEAAKGLQLVQVPLDDYQKAALTSFIFNLGRGNFAGSTLLKKLNAGDYEGAANELPKWNKARVEGVLQPLRGLTRRRKAEKELFETKKKDAK